jgi:hypothetical protein
MYSDVPISAGHQLVFSNKNAQTLYFANKRLVTKAGCSYIRKSGRLRIEFNAARVQQCNYLSFTNTSFENVTFYAKILDYEYVNNETTDILYSIDYWQTYMFDATYHACSILREHLTEEDYQKAVANPWRRDVPELLTDEGLPVSSELEKIYKETTQSSLLPDVYVGERFRVPDNIYESDLNSRYIVFFISAFDYEAMDEESTDTKPSETFLTYWDYINGESDADLTNAFTSWDNGFARSYGVFAIKYDNSTDWKEKMNNALNFFAVWGISSSIVGIYVLPKFIMDGLGDNDGRLIHINLTKDSDIDPKLNTYPFKYIRVISPLDTKEYRIDLFESASNSESSNFVEFRLLANCNGLPTIAIVPAQYKYYTEGIATEGTRGNVLKLNFKERIEYSGFAQVGYSIDSYLTFLSGQYSQAIASNTMSGQADKIANLQEAMAGQGSALLGTISAPVSGVSNVIGQIAQGNFGGAVSGIFGMGNIVNEQAASISRAQANYESAQQSINIQNEAMSSRTGSSAVFDSTKRAYVNDQYTAGSGGGLLAYQLYNISFIFEIVTLADDILQKYDNYLSIYGYKSLRTGRPHICDYVVDGTNTPHFSTFDGETFTYVQTENMQVTGLQQVACSYIENLFNSGCRFLKGD